MDNQTITFLNSRRSLRSFSDRTIDDYVKHTIKEPTIRAPTAGHMVLYSVVDVTSQCVKDELTVLVIINR
jgi:nitroreductase